MTCLWLPATAAQPGGENKRERRDDDDHPKLDGACDDIQGYRECVERGEPVLPRALDLFLVFIQEDFDLPAFHLPFVAGKQQDLAIAHRNAVFLPRRDAFLLLPLRGVFLLS